MKDKLQQGIQEQENYDLKYVMLSVKIRTDLSLSNSNKYNYKMDCKC